MQIWNSFNTSSIKGWSPFFNRPPSTQPTNNYQLLTYCCSAISDRSVSKLSTTGKAKDLHQSHLPPIRKYSAGQTAFKTTNPSLTRWVFLNHFINDRFFCQERVVWKDEESGRETSRQNRIRAVCVWCLRHRLQRIPRKMQSQFWNKTRLAAFPKVYVLGILVWLLNVNISVWMKPRAVNLHKHVQILQIVLSVPIHAHLDISIALYMLIIYWIEFWRRQTRKLAK